MIETMQPAIGAGSDGSQEPNNEGQQFTKAEVEQLIAQALAGQEASYKSQIDAIRAEARRQSALHANGPTDSVAQYLRASEEKATKDASERAILGRLFGPGSDAAAANKLAKEDRPRYLQLRERAAELGLVANPASPILPRSTFFKH